MSKLRITQIKSGIDRPERQKLTLQALGLNKMNASKQVEATPQILGMVRAVSHLLKIEHINGGGENGAIMLNSEEVPVHRVQLIPEMDSTDSTEPDARAEDLNIASPTDEVPANEMQMAAETANAIQTEDEVVNDEDIAAGQPEEETLDEVPMIPQVEQINNQQINTVDQQTALVGNTEGVPVIEAQTAHEAEPADHLDENTQAEETSLNTEATVVEADIQPVSKTDETDDTAVKPA